MKAGCLLPPAEEWAPAVSGGGWWTCQGLSFLTRKFPNVIAFHPKKPGTDISVISGEEEEGTYFPPLSLCCSGVPRAHTCKKCPTIPLPQDHAGEARLGGRMGEATCSSGYFGKLPE